MNAALPISLIVLIGSSLGFALTATTAWSRATHIYLDIDDWLAVEAQNFNGTWAMEDLAPIVPALGEMGTEIAISMDWVVKTLSLVRLPAEVAGQVLCAHQQSRTSSGVLLLASSCSLALSFSFDPFVAS